jgi:hypothetical protein
MMLRLLILLALLFAFMSGPSFAAPAFVQSCDFGSDGTTSATTTCTFGSNTTAGNALVGMYTINDGANNTITSISGCGNTYSRPETVQANTDTTTWFYAENIAGGACTVTVSAGTWGYRTLIVHEVSGVLTSGALDVSVSQALAAGTGANAATSGTDTTTVNGDYIFGAVHIANTLTMTVSPGTGFTGRVTGVGGADIPPYRSEDQIQSTAGSIAATFTLPVAETVHVGMIALKASGGGGGGGGTASRLPVLGVGP